MHERLLQKANKLPMLPGVYIMKDAEDNVIYVGKAKKLKNRVTSYFRGSHLPKVEAMVEKVNDFSVIVVESEFESLVLENSLIKQYVKLFKMDNLKLEITDGAVKKIAELAIARNAGARGLRSIMEEIMLPAMYEAPSMKDISGVKVDLDTVETKKIKYLKKEA